MITCTKRYPDIPFAHRQHNHPGHCRFIHGHNWAFILTFSARSLDVCDFVIDFGGPEMKAVKQWLTDTFDHKLVLNDADPFLGYLLEALGNARHPAMPEVGNVYTLADTLAVPSASSEGLAKWVFAKIGDRVYQGTGGRVQLVSVTVEEDSKNSATFAP